MPNLVRRSGYYQIIVDDVLLERPGHSGNHTSVIELLETLIWAIQSDFFATTPNRKIEIKQPDFAMRFDNTIGLVRVVPPGPGYDIQPPSLSVTAGDGQITLVVDMTNSTNPDRIKVFEQLGGTGGFVEIRDITALPYTGEVLTGKTNGVLAEYYVTVIHDQSGDSQSSSIESGTPEAAGSYDLTDWVVDVSRIQAQVAAHDAATTLWPELEVMRAKCEATALANGGAGAGYLNQRNLHLYWTLYCILDTPSQTFLDWWQPKSSESMTQLINTGKWIGDELRTQSSEISISYFLIKKHLQPGGWWTAPQEAAADAAAEIIVEDNLAQYEERQAAGTFLSDSDYIERIAMSMFSWSRSGLFVSKQARLDAAVNDVLTNPGRMINVIDPNTGYFCERVREGDTYSATNQVAGALLIELMRRDGITTWQGQTQKAAQEYLISLMESPASSAYAGRIMQKHLVNIEGDGGGAVPTAENPSGYGGYKKTRNRHQAASFMPGLSPSSQEHRALRYQIQEWINNDPDGLAGPLVSEHESNLYEILFTDPSESLLDLRNLTITKSVNMGGPAPMMRARRSWSDFNDASFSAIAQARFLAHHSYATFGHYELYVNGIALTRFQYGALGSRASGLNGNGVLIENNGDPVLAPLDPPGNNWGNPITFKYGAWCHLYNTLLPKQTLGVVRPTVYGTPTSDDDHASWGGEMSVNWNNPNIQFSARHDRQIVNAWAGEHKMCFAFDRTVTDPNETSDGIISTRRLARTMRFQDEPTKQGATDWYGCTWEGQRVAYTEALAENTKAPLEILDESLWSTKAALFRNWVAYWEEQSLDQKFLGVHYYPRTGAGTLPTLSTITQSSGDAVRGTHVTGPRDLIVLFNESPETPLTGQIVVDSTTTIAADTEVFLAGASSSILRSVSRSGTQLTITVGAGVSAGVDHVWRGVAA